MHKHLATAATALSKAERACLASFRSLRGPSGKYGGLYASRADTNLRRIRQALVALSGVGLNVPGRDFSDTDLLSEDELATKARQKRALRDDQERARQQQAAEQAVLAGGEA